jgi:hypothetical protein
MERPCLSVSPSHVSFQKILDECGRNLVLAMMGCQRETPEEEFNFG